MAAGWRHLGTRDGFESVFFATGQAGHQIRGVTAAVDHGDAWAVAYRIDTDLQWVTRSAAVTGWSDEATRQIVLESDGCGQWTIDGRSAPELEGCLDVDLESSACTNLLPLRRAGHRFAGPASVPAAYVRAADLRVERLEQTYTRHGPDDGVDLDYDYTAPAFSFACRIAYDRSALVIAYPGLADRVL